MVNIITQLAVAPNGLWEKIISAFNGAVGNYALAIILLTLCIKLLLLPIDFLNRKASSSMTEVQSKLQPKLNEIQKKYPDKQTQNQKIQELYQKEGINPMGSCLPMLISLVVSMVVFFTLFSGLNSMAAYKVTSQYEQLQRAYCVELTDNQYSQKLENNEIDGYIVTFSNTADETELQQANSAVATKYEEVKESFLWIKNIWIADSPLQKSIPSFDSYSNLAGLKFSTEEQKTDAQNAYNAVMGNLEANQGVNGYFLLAILAGVSTFLYQYMLTKKKNNKLNKSQVYQPVVQDQMPDPTAQTNKSMLIIMPMIMVVFTLGYNSIFALYIVVGQLFGTATAPLINKVISKTTKSKK